MSCFVFGQVRTGFSWKREIISVVSIISAESFKFIINYFATYWWKIFYSFNYPIQNIVMQYTISRKLAAIWLKNDRNLLTSIRTSCDFGHNCAAATELLYNFSGKIWKVFLLVVIFENVSVATVYTPTEFFFIWKGVSYFHDYVWIKGQ